MKYIYRPILAPNADGAWRTVEPSASPVTDKPPKQEAKDLWLKTCDWGFEVVSPSKGESEGTDTNEDIAVEKNVRSKTVKEKFRRWRRAGDPEVDHIVIQLQLLVFLRRLLWISMDFSTDQRASVFKSG